MSRKYFGTDGMRGRVGERPATADFILRLGWAAGRVLAKGRRHGAVLIGKDTRISGYMFESALEAGLSAAGVDIRLLGPMPTPAIAYLTRTLRAEAGIVISASHNPHYDNGIKFFGADGAKLPDEIELAIEQEIEVPMVTVDSASLGKAERVVDAAGRYIEFCKSTVPHSLSLAGLKLVVDCAHGATYHVAPSVFQEMGAKVIGIGVQPDGLNINDGCGSTQPDALRLAVINHQADLGVAFDGDGDRVVMVDHLGELVDGDDLLFIIARSRQRMQSLRGPVVGTLMTNLGLERSLQRLGVALIRAAVGDRYVLEAMRREGCVLGGETSGHIICLDRTTTGDGIVSALQVMAEMVDTGQSLHELRAGMAKYPQCLLNVPVNGSLDLENGLVGQALRDVRGRLGSAGRVVLRASGTEPVVRVMVEGEQAEMVEHLAGYLGAVITNAQQNGSAVQG
jgi:phosphoglucosamine mutase